jgi:imidazolonepropionase-like amidohydrolase
MKHILSLLCIVLIVPLSLRAQQAPAYALTNVIIHDPGSDPYSGHLVWRNGTITHIGPSVQIPFDARITDAGDSLHVYPGFIEGASVWGTPEPPRRLDRPTNPGNPGYERAGIRTTRIPSDQLNPDDKIPSQMFNLGFTLAAVGFQDGMLPGQIDVFKLGSDKLTLHSSNLGQKFQLVGAGGAYPNTLMGIMTRFRQLLEDGTALQHHQRLHNANPTNYEAPERDLILEALFPVINKNKPLFITADTKDDIQRVLKLQNEYGFNMVLVSARHAHTMSSEINKRGIPVIASLNISDMPVQRIDSTQTQTQEEIEFFQKRMEAWTAERDNILSLIKAGVRVGLTTGGMKPTDFRKKLQYLIDSGLTENQITSLLTTHTAEILNVGTTSGSIKQGYNASFVVLDRSIMDEHSKVVYVSNGDHLINVIGNTQSGRGHR